MATVNGYQIQPYANLRGANLYSADLRGANLYSANLCGADLSGATLCGARNIPQHVMDVTCITPAGTLRVFKKCREGVVELEVPAAAKRSNATGRKCRAEYAVVISTPNGQPARSNHDGAFIYRPGETVRPTAPFNEDRWIECGAGIHFYLTRGEAEAN